MKLAIYGLHRGSSAEPATMARRARLAEELGFESIWVGDHFALPVGDDGDPPDHPRIEAVVTLAHLAALTTTIRLAFGVIVLPLRAPVMLAKQLSSIDYLSGGRLIVGVGVGYVEQEFRAIGVPLSERGARTDEYLAAMKTLWQQPEPAFDGRFVNFGGVTQYPRPVQRPHPPVVIGGHSAATFRRVIEGGNGWYGWDLDVDGVELALARLRDAGARYDRPAELGELEITITPGQVPDLDQVRRYADAGVHRLVLQPSTMDGTEIDELITTTGETIIARL